MRIGTLFFPPPKTSPEGVEKRFSFRSDFPLPRPRTFGTESRELRRRCLPRFRRVSGNVWGASVLPFADNYLVGWPVRGLRSHAVLSERFGICSMSMYADDLEEVFPRFGEDDQRLITSRQIQGLAQAADRLKASLQESGSGSAVPGSPLISPGGRRRAATAGIA